MKKADSIDDLQGVIGGLEILKPGDASGLLENFRTTTERTRKTIETLARDLRALSTKLPKEKAVIFEKASRACSEIANSDDWNQAEELILLMKAALGGVDKQLQKVLEEKP